MQAHDRSSFGQWLRRSRKSLDLTQEELARQVGCSKGTVRKLESGELRPSRQLAEVLAEHLGVSPAEREAFVRFARSAMPTEATTVAPGTEAPAPWRAPLQPRGNLPIQLTSFVGRAQERADVKQLLAAHRLLTLTGVGGIGKTRLSIQLAAELGDRFPDGVWWVEFAHLFDHALVPQTVASALGVSEQAGQPLLRTLAGSLSTKVLLLVLDNCEHLLEAIAVLIEMLLRACPQLRILATSREPLGIPGEVVYAVPPLSTPGVPMFSSAAALRPEAVQLFVERALGVQPAFNLSGDRAPLIASICMRLDGIPLAIELAAARLRNLSLEQVLSHLDDRFALLNSGPRTALPRHQTLRATIDWSYELLDETERAVFGRLSVFAGGWTLEAAEAVCAGARVEGRQVLAALSHLVDKSLVLMQSGDGQARYWMLETIRQYARDKLLESGEAPGVQEAHAEFCMRLAERAEPQLRGAEQVAWWTRLEAEHDNLRGALSWCGTPQGKAEAGLRLAGALARFWETRDYLSEGREHLAAVLAHPGAQAPSAARAKALTGAGLLAWKQGDYPASQALHQASLSIYRDLDDKHGMATALLGLGDAASGLGEYERAPQLFAESLALWREAHDGWGSAVALLDLGWSLMRLGDYGQATRRLEEALRYFRAAGDRHRTALLLAGLGEAAVRQGDDARARELLEESLALRRELGHKSGIAIALGSLGWLAMRRGELGQARAQLDESLRIRGETGQKGGMAWCLEKLAQVAATAAESERAVRVFGAAAALRTSIGSAIDPVDRPEYQRHLSELQDRLGGDLFAALWAEGEAMPLEDAAAYAQSDQPAG